MDSHLNLRYSAGNNAVSDETEFFSNRLVEKLDACTRSIVDPSREFHSDYFLIFSTKMHPSSVHLCKLSKT